MKDIRPGLDLQKLTPFALIVSFLLVFQSVNAKSEAPPPTERLNKVHFAKTNRTHGGKSEIPVPVILNKTPNLILDLPEDQLDPTVGQNYNANTAITFPNTQRLIAESKKKSAVNLNCGMDVFPNASPETPLSNRLTGACDFKYQY